MRRLLSFRKVPLRFRRWGRKGWSAFCSIGRCVTIGKVSKGIEDASLGKTVMTSMMSDSFCGYRLLFPDVPDGSPPGSPQYLQMAGIALQQDEVSGPFGLEQDEHIPRWRSHAGFPTFFHIDHEH